MKVKVLTQFHDKDNYAHIYEVGEIIEFDDTRANSLISRKLVKSVESAEQKETKSEAEVATSQGVAPKPKDDVKDVPTDTPNANEAEVADNADNAEKAEDVDNAEKADNADNAELAISSTNPFYVIMYEYNGGDSRVCADITTYMNGYNDPRRAAMFTTSTFPDGNGYFGLRTGIAIPDGEP